MSVRRYKSYLKYKAKADLFGYDVECYEDYVPHSLHNLLCRKCGNATQITRTDIYQCQFCKKEEQRQRVLRECNSNNVDLIEVIHYSDTLRVRCRECSTEYDASFKQNPYYFSKCPVCNNAIFHSKKLRLLKLDRLLLERGLVRLFTDEEYTRVNDKDTKKWVTYGLKCRECGTEYEAIINGYNITPCPKCSKSKFRSQREITIRLFLESMGIKIFSNYRRREEDVTYEWDLYLPDYNIAFEFNGNWYHCSFFKSEDYHRLKREDALKRGVRLYFLWEEESEESVKQFILSKLEGETLFKEGEVYDADKFSVIGEFIGYKKYWYVSRTGLLKYGKYEYSDVRIQSLISKGVNLFDECIYEVVNSGLIRCQKL